MAKTYVWRDGARLTPLMNYWLDQLDIAFFRDTGCHIIVSSGIRLFSEQQSVFFARYVPANQVRGRYVYDWRWYRGVLYGRISSAGTVAAPDSPLANHVIENSGSGAVDLRDTGNDAGILTAGSWRDQWMQRFLHVFHFSNEGNNFGERWHKKFLLDPWGPVPVHPTPTPIPPVPPVVTETEDEMRFIYVQGSDSSSIFKVDLSTNTSVYVSKTQWDNIKKSYAANGDVPPLSKGVSTKEALLKAWPLA